MRRVQSLPRDKLPRLDSNLTAPAAG
eukprot:COSAG05_NODE_3872_length_1796_cov_4.811082_3_plen_25_part_01